MPKKNAPSNNPAGRPRTDPSGKSRVMLSVCVAWSTRDRLEELAEIREAATDKKVSLGRIIDMLV